MSKNNIDDLKRVSTAKGFLGYKTKMPGLLYQLRSNKSTSSKLTYRSLVKVLGKALFNQKHAVRPKKVS